MIGQIIQAILDRGFFVNYRFDRHPGFAEGTTSNYHRFDVWKYRGNEQCGAQLMVPADELTMHADPMLTVMPLLERYMREIDEQVTQYRLITEALS